MNSRSITNVQPQVVIYCRKSRLQEEGGIELDRQVELCVEYCLKHGYSYTVFKEQGSSEDWNRPEFQSMLQFLKDNKCLGIVATDLDRLARDSLGIAILMKDIIIPNKMSIFTLNKTYSHDSKEDKFMVSLLSTVDEYLLSITKSKLLRGRIQSVNKGKQQATAPIGYVKDADSKLIPCEKTAHLVKQLFQKYIQGYNIVQLTEWLETQGYKYSTQGVGYILRNKVYCGTIEVNFRGSETHLVLEDAHEPLVSYNQFKQVQRILGENSKKHYKQRGIYSLSGLIVCRECGQSMSITSRKNSSARGNREPALQSCFTSKTRPNKIKWKQIHGNNKCKCIPTSLSRLEGAVFGCLRKHLTDIDKQIESILKGRDDLFNNIQAEQQQLQTQLEQCRKSRKRVQDLALKGIYSDEEALTELKQLDKAKLLLEERLEALEGANSHSIVEAKELAKKKIETVLEGKYSPTETNRVLKGVIDRIEYYKAEKDSKYFKAPIELKIVWK